MLGGPQHNDTSRPQTLAHKLYHDLTGIALCKKKLQKKIAHVPLWFPVPSGSSLLIFHHRSTRTPFFWLSWHRSERHVHEQLPVSRLRRNASLPSTATLMQRRSATWKKHGKWAAISWKPARLLRTRFVRDYSVNPHYLAPEVLRAHRCTPAWTHTCTRQIRPHISLRRLRMILRRQSMLTPQTVPPRQRTSSHRLTTP